MAEQSLQDQVFHTTINSTETVFHGKVWNVQADNFVYPNVDGQQTLRREYVKHTGAIAVVVVNEDQQVLLMQQYRHPVKHKLWEIPAGLLDEPGEDMLSAAQRELAEEADLIADSWATLADIYTTPDGSSEGIRIFVARQLHEIPQDQRHVRDDEEADMLYRWVSIDQAVQLVLAGKLHNGPSVVGILALAASGARKLRDPKAPWLPEGLDGRLN